MYGRVCGRGVEKGQRARVMICLHSLPVGRSLVTLHWQCIACIPYAMHKEIHIYTLDKVMKAKSSQLTISLPPLAIVPESIDPTWFAPNTEDCRKLWDKYHMLGNIRAHSSHVAHIAHTIAIEAQKKAMQVRPDWVLACGLLHDIAKTYTIKNGGSHAQLGAAWIVAETGNPALAQGIMHHVHWPWPLDFAVDLERYFLPLVVIYADKRVKHDKIVSLADRFEDLLTRYGKTEEICEHIRGSFAQAQAIEKALENLLGMALHESSFDSGRLV